MKKKKQKNFCACGHASGRADSASRPADGIGTPLAKPPGAKIFWFFFLKKNIFTYFFLLPSVALAYDNTACWHYAAQQGPHPDITCTPITPALLSSLQNAPLAAVIAQLNEPGAPYPDGTLHYTGNDLNPDGSLLGTIALTLTNGIVTGIDAKLNSPTQGGAYLYYRWTPQSFCSDLGGGAPACGQLPPY